MAISIDELVADLSKEEVFDALLALAKAAGIPVTAWQPGEPMRALLEKLSEWFAAAWNNVIVKAIRAGFLEYALAWVAYGVFRRTETFAGIDALVIENRAGGVYVFVPGDLRVKNAAGKTFTNVTGGALAAWPGSGSFPTVALDFVADEAGSGSNTQAGGIQAYPTQPVKAPAGIYARTNDDPAFGDDTEPDDSLRERCRLSTGPISPGGVVACIESLAKSATRADGSFCDITRVRVLEPGLGIVNVYLAGASGATTGDTVTEGTDVYIANQLIQVYAAKIGITVLVEAATELEFTAIMTLVVDRAANLSASAAEAKAKTAAESYVRLLPIGGQRLVDGGDGRLFASEIAAKASESAEGIIKATLTSGDVELAANEVAVLALGSTYTATVVTQ